MVMQLEAAGTHLLMLLLMVFVFLSKRHWQLW
jgi:hypothetical protein